MGIELGLQGRETRAGKLFRESRHLYFAFSCCTWVLNGAMAPFISESFHLSAAQKGFMVSVPILAVAVIVSIGVGVLAGIVPAFRGAALDPVESLRYE